MALASYLHGEDDDNNYLTGQADPNTTSFVNDEADNFSGRNLPSIPAPPTDNDHTVFGAPVGEDTVANIGNHPKTTQEAAQHVSEIAASRPDRPKAGFWRNLASIGAGLGAGYANANPRLPQVDVGQVMDNVKFGGYARKVADWQNQERDATQQLNAIKTGENETIAQDKEKSMTRLQDSEGRHADAAAYALLHPQPKGPGEPKKLSEYEERLAVAHELGLSEKDPKTLEWIQYGKEPPAAKIPTAPSKSDYLEGKDAKGNQVFYYIDPKDPQNPKPVRGITPNPPKEPVDPLIAINARENAIDARTDKKEGLQENRAISAADVQRNTALAQAEAKAAQKRAIVDGQFNGTIKVPHKPTPDERNQALAQIADELQKEKQLHQDAWETVYGQHGRPVQHVQYGNPLTDKGPGVPPPVGAPAQAAHPAVAPPPAGGSPVDPRVKAYADQYFGGDIAKAKNAIALQRGGR